LHSVILGLVNHGLCSADNAISKVLEVKALAASQNDIHVASADETHGVGDHHR
jgi:hypothetical protein